MSKHCAGIAAGPANGKASGHEPGMGIKAQDKQRSGGGLSQEQNLLGCFIRRADHRELQDLNENSAKEDQKKKSGLASEKFEDGFHRETSESWARVRRAQSR